MSDRVGEDLIAYYRDNQERLDDLAKRGIEARKKYERQSRKRRRARNRRNRLRKKHQSQDIMDRKPRAPGTITQ